MLNGDAFGIDNRVANEKVSKSPHAKHTRATGMVHDHATDSVTEAERERERTLRLAKKQ